MNKRICKIDPRRCSYGDNLAVRVEVSGMDHEGDRLIVKLEDEDAAEFLELAQALASRDSRETRRMIAMLDEQRTLEAE